MRVLRKISFGVDKVCSALVVIMISIMLLATSAQIIWRVGSGFIPWMRPLSWSEELTRFLLVWSTFVGATCAYRHGSNIAITAAQALLPEGGKKAAGVLVHVICMVVFAAVFVYGFQFCQRQVRTTDALPINLPMKFIYACIPGSMVILAFHALVMVLEELTGQKEAVQHGVDTFWRLHTVVDRRRADRLFRGGCGGRSHVCGRGSTTGHEAHQPHV